MNQGQRVIEFMKQNGSITRLEAMRYCSIANLTAIISDLRKHHRIDDVYEENKNQFGEKTRYKRYFYYGELE